MTEELRTWVREGIKKGFELENLKSLLRESKQEDKIKEVEQIYEEEITPPIKLGFFEKWKVKKQLKALQKCINLEKQITAKIAGKVSALSKKEKETIEGLKQDMIKAIIGDKDKEIVGLVTIFEVTNEDGSEITKETLQKESIEDLTELLESLVNALEKEI